MSNLNTIAKLSERTEKWIIWIGKNEKGTIVFVWRTFFSDSFFFGEKPRFLCALFFVPFSLLPIHLCNFFVFFSLRAQKLPNFPTFSLRDAQFLVDHKSATQEGSHSFLCQLVLASTNYPLGTTRHT